MGKLKEIQQKLLSINPARFQSLCDAFLYYTEEGFPPLHCTGSQLKYVNYPVPRAQGFL